MGSGGEDLMTVHDENAAGRQREGDYEPNISVCRTSEMVYTPQVPLVLLTVKGWRGGRTNTREC